MTDGGEGPAGRRQSQDEKDKRALARQGYRHTEITRQRISKANMGKVVTQATKDKLSTIFSNRPLHPAFIEGQKSKIGAANPHAKAVIGRHPEQGVKYFDTLTAAAAYVSGSVAKVCRAIKLSHRHKGWRFEYNKKEIL